MERPCPGLCSHGGRAHVPIRPPAAHSVGWGPPCPGAAGPTAPGAARPGPPSTGDGDRPWTVVMSPHSHGVARRPRDEPGREAGMGGAGTWPAPPPHCGPPCWGLLIGHVKPSVTAPLFKTATATTGAEATFCPQPRWPPAPALLQARGQVPGAVPGHLHPRASRCPHICPAGLAEAATFLVRQRRGGPWTSRLVITPIPNNLFTPQAIPSVPVCMCRQHGQPLPLPARSRRTSASAPPCRNSGSAPAACSLVPPAPAPPISLPPSLCPAPMHPQV